MSNIILPFNRFGDTLITEEDIVKEIKDYREANNCSIFEAKRAVFRRAMKDAIKDANLEEIREILLAIVDNFQLKM